VHLNEEHYRKCRAALQTPNKPMHRTMNSRLRRPLTAGDGQGSVRADQGQTNTDVAKPNPELKPTVVEVLGGLLAVMPFLAPKRLSDRDQQPN
jgi:hypothetical protein